VKPVSSSEATPSTHPQPPGAARQFVRRIRQDPLGLTGLILVTVIVLSALFAGRIVPHDPNALNIRSRLAAPSTTHLLGTDQLGRDVFSRVIMGGRIALWVALTSTAISLVIGLSLGLVAGYGPRWLDNLLILGFDAVRSFPTIMFALAVVTLMGPSLETVIVVVVATSIPAYGRVVRTQTQALRHNEFILAERAQGAGMTRVLVLSFLGLGVKPPTPSWGSILYDGYSFIRNTPWLVLAGGLPLIVTTLGFTFLGESLRDIFDPKLNKEH
jgi:peptide/nickel transport system permease protein